MTVSPKKKKPAYAGLSISHRTVELAVFSPKTLSVEQAVSLPVPAGLFHHEMDTIQDPAILKDLIGQLLRMVKLKSTAIHLSLPATLLRMVEMPKMDSDGMYLSLSSEAERYKVFDNAEAIVDFFVLEQAHVQAGQQQLVLGALRSDALTTCLKILKELRLKVHSIGLEPLMILRGMAGTGVLDSLVQQIGVDAHWGMVLVDDSRVRFSLWQCDRLIELRELSMDTRNFAQAAQDPVFIEDLLDEIRRTTKTLQPALWLTHNMPPALEQALSAQLGCPVRPAPIGNSVAMPQPLELSTLGSAMTSVVPFPFDIDIAEGMNKSGTPVAGGGVSGVVSDSSGGSGEIPAWLMPAGVLSILLGLLITGGLWAMASVVSAQLPEQQSKVDTAKVEVAGLQSRQQELKKKAELDQTLKQMVEDSKIRNHVYVALTEDLRENTPKQVWVQTLTVDNKMELAGKAMNHKSVLNFAKSFDAAPYTKAVLIDAIKEGKLGGQVIYEFKISGGVKLDKSLLPPEDPNAAAPGSGSAPVLQEPGA